MQGIDPTTVLQDDSWWRNVPGYEVPLEMQMGMADGGLNNDKTAFPY